MAFASQWPHKCGLGSGKGSCGGELTDENPKGN